MRKRRRRQRRRRRKKKNKKKRKKKKKKKKKRRGRGRGKGRRRRHVAGSGDENTEMFPLCHSDKVATYLPVHSTKERTMFPKSPDEKGCVISKVG